MCLRATKRSTLPCGLSPSLLSIHGLLECETVGREALDDFLNLPVGGVSTDPSDDCIASLFLGWFDHPQGLEFSPFTLGKDSLWESHM